MNGTRSINNLLLLIFCVFAINVQAQTDRTGTTGANFLKLGTDARSMGMGDAVTSLPGNIMSAYWNPAAIDFQNNHIGLMHHVYLQGIFQDYVGFFQTAAPKFGFGVSFNYLNAGTFDQTIKTGPNQFEKQGTFTAWNYYLSLTSVYSIDSTLQIGMSMKGIQEKIADYQGSAFAMDLGIWYGLKKLNFGLAIRNLGSGIQLKEERFDLPIIFNGGISFTHQWFTVTLDLHKPIDNIMQPKLGVEFRPFPVLSLRGGYRFGYLKNDLGGSAGLSLGLGIHYDQFSFDYAYNPLGLLGQSHRISLIYSFSKKSVKESAVLYANANPDVVLRRNKAIVQSVQFHLELEHCNKVNYWELVILDENNRAIRTWKGRNPFPRVIHWDGKDELGNPVPATTYQYNLQVLGCDSKFLTANGNITVTDLEVTVKKTEKKAAVVKKRTRHFTLGDVLFDTDRATIRASEEGRLAKLIQFLKEHPDAQVIIEGHTDDRASSEYNMMLSLARANSVMNYLVKHAGLSPDQIVVQGFGETKPIVPNTSEENRQKNRRVEIIVTYVEKGTPERISVSDLFKAGKYKEVIAQLREETLENLKKHPNYLYFLGESYFHTGDYRKAQYYLKEYVQLVQHGGFRQLALQRLGELSLKNITPGTNQREVDGSLNTTPQVPSDTEFHSKIESWYRLIDYTEKAALLYDASFREESSETKALLLGEARKAEERARTFAEQHGFIFVKLIVNDEQSIYELFSKVPELQKAFLQRKIIYAWNGKISSVHTLTKGQIIFVIAK